MYQKSLKTLEKLERMDYFDNRQLKTLHGLASSKNKETRRRVAALLGQQYDRKSESVLYNLTYDRDETVKLEAVDSLSIGRTKVSLQRLRTLTESKDFYIRYFAVQSHYDVYVSLYSDKNRKAYLDDIKKKILIEDSLLVKLALYKIAYFCGEDSAFDEIVNILTRSIDDNNHSLISPALNILDEMIEEPSYEFGLAIKPLLNKLDNNQYELALSMIAD